VLRVERSPFPAGTFLPVLPVSPVALRTRGLTAGHGGTAHWQAGPSISIPLCLSHHPRPSLSPGFSPCFSPDLSPGLSSGLSPGLSPGIPELDQPLQLRLV